MHRAAFTLENAAMLMIDPQLATMGWPHSHDINLVEANALTLAKIATALDLPVVLTASMEDQVQGPLMPELEQVLPAAFGRRVMSPGPRAAALSFHFSRHRESICEAPRRNAER
jgi:hypothetical protein